MDSDRTRKHLYRQPASVVRLSCEACTKRKVKCNRLIPCNNCRNSGIICVPVERKRLPRGRSRRAGILASCPISNIDDRTIPANSEHFPSGSMLPDRTTVSDISGSTSTPEDLHPFGQELYNTLLPGTARKDISPCEDRLVNMPISLVLPIRNLTCEYRNWIDQ